MEQTYMFTRETCLRTYFSLAEILVLAGTADAGGMAPPTSTRMSARLKCVQERSSPVHMPRAAPPASNRDYAQTLVLRCFGVRVSPF